MSLVDCASSQRQRHQLEFCQGEERFTGPGKAIITRQRKEEVIHFLQTGNLPVGESNLTALNWKKQFKLVQPATEKEGLGPLLAAASSSKQAEGGPLLRYLSFDELFPVLYSCHGHRQRIPNGPESRCKRLKEMHAVLKEHYSNVSQAVLKHFLDCCPLCRLEREAGVRNFTGDTVVGALPKCIWSREQPFKEVHAFDQPRGRDEIIPCQRRLQVLRIASGPFHRSATAGAGGPELSPCHQSPCTQEHSFLVEFAPYSAFDGAAADPEILTTEQLGRPAGATRPMLRAYLNGRTSNQCSICEQQAEELIGCAGCLRSLCLPCLCPCYKGRLRRLHVFTCHLCAGAALPGKSKSDWFFPGPPDRGHPPPRPLRAKATKHLAKREAGTAALLAEHGRAPHAYPSLGEGGPKVVLLGDGSAAAQGVWGTVKRHVVDEGLILFRPTSGPEEWVWANFTSFAARPLPCLPRSSRRSRPPAPPEEAPEHKRPLSVFLENSGMVARPPFDHERLQLRWCTSTRSPVIVGGQAPLALGDVVFVPRRKVGDEGDVGRTKKPDHCGALDDGVSEATDHIGKLVRIGVRDPHRNPDLVSEVKRQEHVTAVGQAWDHLRSAVGRVDTSSRLMLQLQWLSPARDLTNDIARPRDEDGVLMGSPSCRKRVDRATLFDTGSRNWVCCGAARFENMPRLVTRAELVRGPGDEVQGRPRFFVAAKHFQDRERGCWVLWDVCGDDTLSTQQARRLEAPFKVVDLFSGMAGASLAAHGSAATVTRAQEEERRGQVKSGLLVDSWPVACASAVMNLNAVGLPAYLLKPDEQDDGDAGSSPRKRAKMRTEGIPVLNATIEELLHLITDTDEAPCGNQNHAQRVAREGVRDVAILCWCPPCQTYSTLNHARYKPAETTIEADDPNIMALLQSAEVVLKTQPEMWIFENVAGLVGFDDRISPLLGRLIGKLAVGAGYSLTMRVVESREFSVPQKRRRLIMMGCKTRYGALAVPKPTDRQEVVVKDAIRDLPKKGTHARYTRTGNDSTYWGSCQRANLTEEMKAMFTDASEELEFRPDGRMGWDALAPAVSTSRDCDRYKNAHPLHDRHLSTRERLRIQGYRDSAAACGSRTQRWTQTANLLPGPLGYSLVGACLDLLTSHHHGGEETS